MSCNEHWADAYEPNEELADSAEALEHIRAIEALASRHCWKRVLELLGEIECALPPEE